MVTECSDVPSERFASVALVSRHPSQLSDLEGWEGPRGVSHTPLQNSPIKTNRRVDLSLSGVFDGAYLTLDGLVGLLDARDGIYATDWDVAETPHGCHLHPVRRAVEGIRFPGKTATRTQREQRLTLHTVPVVEYRHWPCFLLHSARRRVHRPCISSVLSFGVEHGH